MVFKIRVRLDDAVMPAAAEVAAVVRGAVGVRPGDEGLRGGAAQRVLVRRGVQVAVQEPPEVRPLPLLPRVHYRL